MKTLTLSHSGHFLKKKKGSSSSNNNNEPKIPKQLSLSAPSSLATHSHSWDQKVPASCILDFNALPVEIKFMIFSFLDGEWLCIIQRVCKGKLIDDR